MALEVRKPPGSSQRNVSRGSSKASKIKSAEFIKDSDEEEPVETSNNISKEGAEFTPSNNFKASVPVGSTTRRKKDAKVQDVASSQKQSPVVQNGRLPKKPKLDISSSFNKSKASAHVEPLLTGNKAFKFANPQSFSKQKPLELNGRLPKKQKLDISSPSGSDSQESDSQNDGEESRDGSESDTSSSAGTSDGGQSETSRTMERSKKRQSETSSSVGRSNESGAQLAYKNSALPSQMSVPRRTAPPYVPPPGFKSAPITLHPASKIVQLVSPSALDGKELWHVTVPNSVPISSITEVSTKSIFTGAAILSHDGAEYGLSPETQSKKTRSIVLFPSSQTANYESAGINIARSLHLQRIVHSTNSAAGSDKPTEGPSMRSTKNKNEQPPGLKMRYRPFGASSDSSEKSDSEPIVKEPLSATHFQIPRNIIDSSPSKRKRDQTDQTDETQSPARVKRKKKSASTDALTELEQVLDQHISHNKAPNELSEVYEAAESKAHPHHSATSLANEPANAPRPKSPKKPKTHQHHHQHEEIDSPIPLSNPKTPIKPTTSLHYNPVHISIKKSPTTLPKSFLSKLSPILPPPPQTTTSPNAKPLPDEESQQQPLIQPHEIEIQQHAGKLDTPNPPAANENKPEIVETPQVSSSYPDPNSNSKSNSPPKSSSSSKRPEPEPEPETPETEAKAKARRKAERRKNETPEESAQRNAERMERRLRKEDRKRRRGE